MVTENTIVYYVVLANGFIVLKELDSIQGGLCRLTVTLWLLWTELDSDLVTVELFILTKHHHTTVGMPQISAFPNVDRISCRNAFHTKSLNLVVYFCTKKRKMVLLVSVSGHLDEQECTKVGFNKWSQLWPNWPNTFGMEMTYLAS